MEVIQQKHGIQPVQSRGLEILPSVDRVWRTPEPGKKEVVDLSVTMTNRTKQEFCLDMWSGVGAQLRDDQGVMVDSVGWTNGWGGGCLSVKPGGVESIRFKSHLELSSDGKNICLLTMDPNNGFWSAFRNLKRGRYYINFCHCEGQLYRNIPNPTWNQIPVWTGGIESYYLPIDIR